MRTQKQIETNQMPQMPKAPMTYTANAKQDELFSLRRELASHIEKARSEIGILTVERHRAEASRIDQAIAKASLRLKWSVSHHIELVTCMKAELIRKTVERRLSKITECRFQMMVDGVPFYEFSDLETGTRFEGIAYGTQANWVMYQMKADLEKAVRHATNRELVWVDEALTAWSKILGN
jgi:hypothetical protein